MLLSGLIEDDDEHDRAHEARHHADRQLQRVQERPRDKVRQHEEDRAAEHRRGQQPPVVGADEHPRHMRRHEADKADRPADGDADADEHRDRNEQHELRSLDIHADLAGVVLADGEGVEDLRVQQDHRAAHGQRECQHGGILIRAAAERAHGPEGDLLDLIGGKGDDNAHDARDEHREDHADEDDRVGRERPVELVRKPEDDQQRAKREQNRHHHRPREREARQRDAEGDGADRAERRAGRNAERRAVCQRVFEQPLHTRARKRQRRAAERDAQNARQAHRQQNGGRQPLRLRRVLQRVAKDRQRIRQRNVDASHADTQTHHRRQNSDEQQILPEGKVLRSCLHTSS